MRCAKPLHRGVSDAVLTAWIILLEYDLFSLS